MIYFQAPSSSKTPNIRVKQSASLYSMSSGSSNLSGKLLKKLKEICPQPNDDFFLFQVTHARPIFQIVLVHRAQQITLIHRLHRVHRVHLGHRACLPHHIQM